MRCLSFFLQVDSNGEILNSLTGINILVIVQKDVYSKFVLNVLKSYKKYTMINTEIKGEMLSNY